MSEKTDKFRTALLPSWKWRRQVLPKSCNILSNVTPLYADRQQYYDCISYVFPALCYFDTAGCYCTRKCLEYTESTVVQGHIASHVMKQILNHLVMVCADMISDWPRPYHVIAGHTDESRVHPRAVRLRILKSFKDELVYKTRE